MRVKDIRRENLRSLARQVGGITALARFIGKEQSQISHIIGIHPQKNIGDRFADQVERVFGMPQGWLDSLHLDTDEFSYFVTKPQPAYSWVPLIAWQDIPNWSKTRELKSVSRVHVLKTVSTFAFALVVQDNSMQMENTISFAKGSILITEPEMQLQSGSYVIAQLKTQTEILFRKFVRQDNKTYLVPLNNNYCPVEFKVDDCIYGIVSHASIDFNPNLLKQN